MHVASSSQPVVSQLYSMVLVIDTQSLQKVPGGVMYKNRLCEREQTESYIFFEKLSVDFIKLCYFYGPKLYLIVKMIEKYIMPSIHFSFSLK
jgi:hypothetical protein